MALVAFEIASLAVAVLVLAPLLAHFRLLPPLLAFKFWLASALPGLAAIVVALVALPLGGNRMHAAAALVLGALPVATLYSVIRSGRKVPRINDVSTDLDDPPAFVEAKAIPANAGRDFSYRDRFKEKVRAAYGDLAPITRAEPPAAAVDRAVAAAKSLGWEITATDAGAGRIEAIAISKLWNFRDDIAIRVRPAAGGSRIDVRSKSRDGNNDFGANAARIRAFAAALR